MKCKKCEMYLLDSHICWNCGFDNNSKEEPAVVKEKPVLPINNDDVLTESNKKENNDVALVEQQDIEPTLNVVEEVENNQEDFPFIEENNDGEVIVVDFSVEEKEEGPKEDEPALDEEVETNQEDQAFLENENSDEPIIVSFTEEDERVEDIIVPVLDEEDNREESEISISKYDKFIKKIKELEFKNKHFSLMLLYLAFFVSMSFSKVHVVGRKSISLIRLTVSLIFKTDVGNYYMINRSLNNKLILISIFLIVALILVYHIVSWTKKSQRNNLSFFLQIVLIGFMFMFQKTYNLTVTPSTVELGAYFSVHQLFAWYCLLIQKIQLRNINIDDKIFKKEDYLQLTKEEQDAVSKYYDKKIFRKMVLVYILLIVFIVGYFLYSNSTYGLFFIAFNNFFYLKYWPIFMGIIFFVFWIAIFNVFFLYQYIKGKEKFIAEDEFKKNSWFVLRLLLTIFTLGVLAIPLFWIPKKNINNYLKRL